MTTTDTPKNTNAVAMAAVDAIEEALELLPEPLPALPSTGPMRPVVSAVTAGAAATKQLLAEREPTHGRFPETARVEQALREALRSGPSWDNLSVTQKSALEHRTTKLARIVCGNPKHADHWRDDDGYAMLGVTDVAA